MNLSLEVITGIVGFTAAFIIKEGWDLIRKKKESESDKINHSLDKNTDAVNQLQIALVELKLRIEYLADKLTPLPKLSKDVGEAHAKIRDLKMRMDGGLGGGVKQ